MLTQYTCPQCGKRFTTKFPSIKRVFCSHDCWNAHQRNTWEDRFWAKIDRSGGPDACWDWTLGGTDQGYGRTRRGKYGPKMLTHRVAYELAYGPIPDGLMVCHKCDRPPCCNPGHLFLGTKQDNADDMVKKGRAPNHAGISNGNAKLTEDDVRYIRQQRAVGVTTVRLANEFGVTTSMISRVARRENWKHVE